MMRQNHKAKPSFSVLSKPLKCREVCGRFKAAITSYVANMGKHGGSQSALCIIQLENCVHIVQCDKLPIAAGCGVAAPVHCEPTTLMDAAMSCV